jgi:hypothetical protein
MSTEILRNVSDAGFDGWLLTIVYIGVGVWHLVKTYDKW